MLKLLSFNLIFAASNLLIESLLGGRILAVINGSESDTLLLLIIIGAILLEFIALILSIPFIPRGKSQNTLQGIWALRFIYTIAILAFMSLTLPSDPNLADSIFVFIQIFIFLKEIMLAVILGTALEEKPKVKPRSPLLAQICLFISLSILHLTLSSFTSPYLFLIIYLSTQTLTLLELTFLNNYRAWAYWGLSLALVALTLA